MSEAAVKKYVVRLSAEERQTLAALISKGKHPAALVLKARILLKADVSEAGEGCSDSRIVKALDVSPATIYRTRQRLVEEGFEAVLARKHSPNSARPRIFDGAAEAKLIALTCSPPPKGRAKWTLRLLEDTVVELNIVERASDNTIGRTLKKRSQTASEEAVCHSARGQRRFRRQHGRCAGRLSPAARFRMPRRLLGRDLEAVDRRNPRANPGKTGTARPGSSSQSSARVIFGRRNSRCTSAQSGTGRWSVATAGGGGYSSASSWLSSRPSGSGQLSPARRARAT